MSEFNGFSKNTVAFLRGLSKNNNKEWFDSHRAAYEEHFIGPAKAFVEAVGEELRRIAPRIQVEPRVNGSIFRINRDIRFSKDKTPYKDHMDLWFWEGARKGAVSEFFWRLTSSRLLMGVGAHQLDKEQLTKYRQAIVAPPSGTALLKVVRGLEKAGFEVEGERFKRQPKGFEVKHPALEKLLLHDALYTGVEVKHPDELKSAKIVSYCTAVWKRLLPLHRWLADTLQ